VQFGELPPRRAQNITKNYFVGLNILKINIKMDFKKRANGERSSGSRLCIVPCACGQSGLSWIYNKRISYSLLVTQVSASKGRLP
jgi:hypothetical protein